MCLYNNVLVVSLHAAPEKLCLQFVAFVNAVQVRSHNNVCLALAACGMAQAMALASLKQRHSRQQVFKQMRPSRQFQHHMLSVSHRQQPRRLHMQRVMPQQMARQSQNVTWQTRVPLLHRLHSCRLPPRAQTRM
jgi:hypothetical protein